jgi:16S rRNA (cytosine1402-N4)-methyltransferase
MSNFNLLNSNEHRPVLLDEVLDALNICQDGIYIDCTFGRGGHTQAILDHLGTSGKVLAFDHDPEAVQVAQTLSDKRFTIIDSSFAQLGQHIKKLGWLGKVNGLLLDLGVSSPQLNTPARGFSFMHDGPLDMRMNPNSGESVGEWLIHATFQEITDILKSYGEERYARRIAKAIITAREQTELKTTRQLADLITSVNISIFNKNKSLRKKAAKKGIQKGFKHPATRSFQALRIFINQELEQLQQILPQTLDVLAPDGRLVVISFHSLEDRIVKWFIRDCVRGDHFPPTMPVTSDQLSPTLRTIGQPIKPSETEMNTNPRARSAIMRVAEKI